jgi:hypothetical protein
VRIRSPQDGTLTEDGEVSVIGGRECGTMAPTGRERGERKR